MAYQYAGDAGLEYFPCRYGASKLLFRGPPRSLKTGFLAVLGGSETYGKFVQAPYPALLEAQLSLPVLNLGLQNAGLDVFVHDPAILELCNRARLTVLQLLGAHNLTNRYYTVHPRRNDRFVAATPLLETLFPEVDFTEFHFTRHMLLALKYIAPDRFALVEAELRRTWVARMRVLLQQLAGPKLLLWVGDHHPDGKQRDALGREPLFINAAMVDAICPAADHIVRVRPSLRARDAGTAGMVFDDIESLAAAELPGPSVHAEIATSLAPAILDCMK